MKKEEAAPAFANALSRGMSFYINRLPFFRGKRKLLMPFKRFLRDVPVQSKYGVQMKLDVSDRTNWYGVTAHYGTVVSDEIARLGEGDCFIDVGSNCGVFTLLARKHVGQAGLVVAFEPCFATFAKLVANIQHNGYSNVIVFNLCVSDRSETLQMEERNARHSGKCAVTGLSNRQGQFAAGISLADFTGLASIIGRRRTVVKVDVEGYELIALKGLAPILSRSETTCVVVEIDAGNLSKYGSGMAEVYGYLQSRGFRASGGREGEEHFDEVFSRKAAA